MISRLSVAALVCVLGAQSVNAAEPVNLRHFTEEEVAAVKLPDTTFEETDLIVADYDKYFYFQRADTSFDEAWADITECDALASGIRTYGKFDASQAIVNSGLYSPLAAGVGGAIGSAVADAIFGSSERRKVRRINIRNCMGFKGYSRFGLERELWQAFNFEEGLTKTEAGKREIKLMMQARLASAPMSNAKELGL